MAWLTNFLQPTQSFLVAFDIASSSQNYLNPNGLQRDRQGLFQAIDQTRLVRRCVAFDAVGGQFLGDEYRLAFPVNGNHGAISATEVVEFVDEVFSTLESAASASIGYAPVVRAIMAKGSVEARELGGFGYLMGGVPFETLSKLSKAVGNQVNILVSDENLRPMLESETIAGLDLYVKRYSSRRIPQPFSGSPHNNNCTDHFVISVTNAKHHSDDGLIQIARYVLNSLSSTISGLKVMVGPTSIVFAIPEAQFNQSRTLLSEIQQCAINYGQSIAAAIGSGLGRVIPGSRWTTGSFESGTAIEMCRITSELAPGTLAIPDRESVIELLAPLSRSLTEQVRIQGKRDEVFDALVSDSYFGNPAGRTAHSVGTINALSVDATSTQAPVVPTSPRSSHQTPSNSLRPNFLQPVLGNADIQEFQGAQKASPKTSSIGSVPTEVNNHHSMHITLGRFSGEDWKRLEELLQRTVLEKSSRETLLIKVFGNRIEVGAVANLLQIPSVQDFFQQLIHTIQKAGDDGIFRRYLESLQGYVLNQSDLDWLKSRLEPDEPPPVEPDTFGVVLEALVSLLQSDKALLDALLAATKELGKEYFQTPPANAGDLVLGILSHPFPLQCFNGILRGLYLKKLRFNHDSAVRSLHICKAYFRIASLPAEDKKVVYTALEDAFLVSRKSSQGASRPIQTANKQFAEDLLISTWIQVSQRPLENSEIYKLIHREPISGNPITDADRIVFATVRILSQPTDPDNSSRLSIWFAKCCWQELMGTSVMPEDPIEAVNNDISQMAKLKAATAMFITRDRTEAIQELKKTFPQLVLIPLSETDAKRYSEILTEMNIIEKLINQICQS